MKALRVTCALDVAFGTASSVTAQSYPPDGSTIPTVTLNGSPANRQPAPKPANQQSAWNTELAGHSDLQGRSAYQPIIINENGREIAYVGHHTGKMPNPLTGAVEGNGTKIYDLSDPATPVYIRDFGLLGQQPGATSFQGVRAGIQIHGPISAGVAKNRVYAAYGTGGDGVIQILDRKKLLSAFSNALKPTAEEMLAPQVGYIVMSPDQGAHTAMPMYGVPIPGFQGHSVLKTRDLLVVASEQGRGDHCRPGPGGNRSAPHLGFLLDITNEPTPWPLATFHVPENPGDFCGRGGRFGAHAGTESFYPPYYGKLAIFSWFNAGTRVFDIRNPFAVEEGAYFIPAPNKNTMAFCADGISHPDGDPKITPACTKVIQTNNVEVDDRGLIYSADRAGTGLHIIRLKGRAAQVPAKQ